MVKRFSQRNLIILFGIFALLFLIFLALQDAPTARSDDPAGTVIESDDPSVTQQGTWTTQSSNNASGGSYLYSSGDEADALLLPFEGNRIEIIYVKNPALGDFAIEIDNNIHRTVVTTSDETSFGHSAVVDYLDAGPHVLRVFAVEGVIAIDAFIGTPFTLASSSETTGLPPDADVGPMRIGEIEQSNQVFSYHTETDSLIQTIYEPGASFIKVHFAEMDLADGETVTVSNPDGTEIYTYPGSGFTTDGEPGFWAFSIIGDTAIVEIHGRSPNPSVTPGNVTIDKYGRGYSDSELAIENRTESICGVSDLADVACRSSSHPTEFNKSHAVARILFPTPQGMALCTAWRISPSNYMLTNEHCINDQGDVVATEVRFNYQLNTCGGTLNTGTVVSGATFLTTNFTLDFTLFTVNQFANISSFGYLDPDVRTPTLNEEIYIPQHASGQPKKFGIESDANTGNVCRIDDATINGYGIDTDTGYRCDTEGGSSGSPVLARSTNRVIALHHFGSGGSGGFCNVGTGVINTGVRMDLIWPYISSLIVPNAPSLIAPTGSLEDITPTYSWYAVPDVTYYQLYVNGPSGNVISQWYSVTEAGCESGTGTCSITPTTNLALGAHQWWVQSWRDYYGAAGKWSSQGNFTISIPAPSELNRISPTGNVSTNPPTFTWNADPYAEWYQLYVTGPSGSNPNAAIINTWYSKTDAACPAGIGTCSITPTVVQQGGAHQWWIRAYGPGGYGPWTPTPMNFTQTNGIVLPQVITITAPSGDVSVNPPTYQWNADPWADWYHIVVVRASKTVEDKWYTKTEAGCPSGTGTCSISTGIIQQNGQHTLWIQGYNSLGYGPWNLPSGWVFTQTNGNFPLAVITMTAPSGDTADNTPTYMWSANPWAEWYNIAVMKGSATVFNLWFSKTDAGCPTGTGTCSVTPTNVLSKGDHTMWMRAWNSVGYGPWNSVPLNFNVTVGPPTTATTLISPNSPQTTNKPTFTWNAVSDATRYRLYVSGPGPLLHDQWFTAAAVGCPSGTGTCSFTPSGALLTTGGTHTFWVDVGNEWGDGPWSAAQSFTYTPIPPIAVNLIAPTGTIGTSLPVYEWEADPNASYYQLWVGTPSSTTVVAQWYTRAQAGCGDGTGTCSVKPTTPYLAPGSSYQWSIQSYNSAGSVWREPTYNFNLSDVAGFIDTFDTTTGNWTFSDTWVTMSGHHYTVAPEVPSSWSTSYYNQQTYDNVDVSARLYRTGCVWCENGIIVRGTPSSLYNKWESGYGFFYSLDGYFTVVRYEGGDDDPIILQNWTPTSALNQGQAYKTLRVRASGSSLYLYINNVLVWTGTDSTYSTGNIGIAMYRGSQSLGHIYADWVVAYRFD